MRYGVAIIALAACSTGPTSLGERAFVSTEVTLDGQPHPLFITTQIGLRFTDEPEPFRVMTGAMCNGFQGHYRIEDDRLVLLDGGYTEIGCEPPGGEQDDWLFDFITRRPTFDLVDPDLTLTYGGGVITMVDVEVAYPDLPFSGRVHETAR